MAISRSLAAVLCALCLALPACDESKKDDGARAGGKEEAKAVAEKVKEKIEADAKEAAEDLADKRAGKADDAEEDKGSATLRVGDGDWTARRAKARLRNGTLSISASNMDMKDGKASRQELRFSIKDFDGPGSYKTGMGSMFVGVGFDMEKAKEAEGDDAKTQKMAVDTIKGADTIMIMSGKVEITEVTDDFIDGTIEYLPAAQSRNPGIAGDFHAVLDKD